MQAIDLNQKLGLFTEQWTPKIIGTLDDNMVAVTKLEGDFVWHAHADNDELFLVLDGRLRMDFRDREIWVEAGQIIIVPAGTEHKPYAEHECSVLLIEKASTDHTGGVDDPRRKETHERI